MSNLQKIKKRFGKPIQNMAYGLGIDIQEVHGPGPQILKLRSITDLKRRRSLTEELSLKFPRHPMVQLELAQCYHRLSDNRQFKQMDKYADVRNEWLIKVGLEDLNVEFIGPEMVIGSLGNHYAVESIIKANRYGLRPSKKLFLLLSENAKLRNPALFEYFENELFIIREKESIQSLKRLENLLTIPLGIGLPMHDGFPYLDIAANQVEMEREKLDINEPFFTLSDHHKEMGFQALKKLSLPGDAWYVTLHVRERGYRGESLDNASEDWRNANPLDYIKAIEAVTKAGGWVFRIGNPKMTPLPKMPQVIDYAHHEIRCDWMDVFLGATCKFLIGTGSGYYHIPAFFGVPYILTNYPGFTPYYGMRSLDLYLPRLLKKVQTEKLVSFEEYMSPPTSMFWSLKDFRYAGLVWVENTPEELAEVTKEMLKRNSGSYSSKLNNDELQRKFKTLAETSGLKYSGGPVKAFAPISHNFLEKNHNLLH